MFDYASIMNLTHEDILILKELACLVDEAKMATKQIQETYTFHIGEDKIEIRYDEHRFELITYDGVWLAYDISQNYKVVCTVESIFEVMAAEYLVQHEYVAKYDGDRYTKEGELASVMCRFRDFLDRTAKVYAKANSDK